MLSQTNICVTTDTLDVLNEACTKTRNNETKPPKRNDRNERNERNETSETTETTETIICFSRFVSLVSVVSVVSDVSFRSFRSFRLFRSFRFGGFVSLFRVLVHAVEGHIRSPTNYFYVTAKFNLCSASGRQNKSDKSHHCCFSNRNVLQNSRLPNEKAITELHALHLVAIAPCNCR